MNDEAVSAQAEEQEPEIQNYQIVRAANEWFHPLEPYGQTRALREITRRIMFFDRGKIKMTASEAGHLAQVAASSWLNPFTGEIWGWPTVRGAERKFTIMPGRKGLLRHAHEQAAERNTYFWPEYRRLSDPDKVKALMVPPGALVYECLLRDTREMEAWKEALAEVTKAKLAGLEVSLDVLGPPPFTYGIGVLTASEMTKLDESGTNKMTHVERCQKRAFMMALKQKFHLPLAHAIGSGGETVDDFVLDVEVRELPALPEGDAEGNGEQKAVGNPSAEAKASAAAADPLGPAKAESTINRPYPAEIVRDKIRDSIGTFTGSRKTDKVGELELWQMVGWQLGEAFAGSDDQDQKRHAALAYLLNKNSSKDLNGAECRAILRWLDPKEYDGPGAGLRPNPFSIKEAQAVLNARLIELGQIALDMELET